MSKKFIISATFAFLLIALALIVGKFWGGGEKTGKENSYPTKQEMGNDLVWFQIPELNIQFQVEKEIADAVGFVASGEKSWRLYAKSYPKTVASHEEFTTDTFAYVVENKGYRDNTELEWVVSCEGDSCCPGEDDEVGKFFGKLLIKTDEHLVCYFDSNSSKRYNETSGVMEKFDNITKKLFDGYLKTVPVEPI